MLHLVKAQAIHAAKIAIGVAPLLVSFYALYWLEKQSIWTSETAHRDKMTIAIVALGMTISFLLLSRFAKSSKS